MKRIIIVVILLISTACLMGAVEPFDLQAEIDNAPNGGTVTIPCGVYDIGNVVIASDDVWQKVVTIQGCGHAHLGQSPAQGSQQWDWMLENGYHYGTVLRGTISVRLGTFPDATTAKAYFRDFSMIGKDGKGIAIDYGNGIDQFPEGSFEDVSFGNYDIGIRLQNVFYTSIDDVSMAGVGIGLQIVDSNVITISGLNIMSCGVGLENNGAAVTFIGGSVQGCEYPFNFGGASSILGGYYFENNTNPLDVSGRANTVLSNWYSGNSGGILISGQNNKLFAAEWSPIVITGWYNEVELSKFGTCVNTVYPKLNKCKVISE